MGLVFCECGCGDQVIKSGNSFIHGHQNRGRKFSAKHKANISRAQIKRYEDPVKRKRHKDGCNTLEAKVNKSVAFLGKKKSAEAKANMSAAQRKWNSENTKRHSDETKAKMSALAIKRCEDPALRAKRSVDALKQFQDPENCRRHKEGFTEEVRIKMSASQTIAQNRPEALAKNSAANTGNKNSNWQGGISFLPYSSEWTYRLRESIRERDGHICQMCGKGEEQNGRKLDVHHIDSDKNNCSEYNLISLCCSCHDKTKSKKNKVYWQVILTEKNCIWLGT